MDLTAMYLASPDYVNAIWSLAPWVTVMIVVHLLLRRAPDRSATRSVPGTSLLLEARPGSALPGPTVREQADKEKAPREEGPGKSGLT